MKGAKYNRHVTKGSVLDDLGFDQEHLRELKLKAEIHQGILKTVKRRHLKPRDLERILNVLQQPRVSELMCGKLSLFSMAKLLDYANCLGLEAEIKLKSRTARTSATR